MSRTMTLTTFAIVVILVSFTSGQPDCSRGVDVAIVGAGPSGAYSAYRYQERKNVTVELFELSDRIGGRVYTTSFPGVPGLKLEAGAMMFYPELHPTVQGLVQKLGLQTRIFQEDERSGVRYYLRGQNLMKQLITQDGDLPFKLSPEEKINQHRLAHYYLEKLIGASIKTPISHSTFLGLKVSDGRELFKLTFDEALDLVATKEGKELLQALTLEFPIATPLSALSVFENLLGDYSGNRTVATLTDGMSALPARLVEEFLNSNPRQHKLTINRRLDSIEKRANGSYTLVFQKTMTQDKTTTDLGETDVVCAKTVILALPKCALRQLKWERLKEKAVAEAINDAVRDLALSKVFFTFPSKWWLQSPPSNITFSDLTFTAAYDWGQTRKDNTLVYGLLASSARGGATSRLEQLNSVGEPIQGSMPGPNKVSSALKEELLTQLARVVGLDREKIPEPLHAMSQFWTLPSDRCGLVTWRFGYNYEQVSARLEQQLLSGDIYLVGSDHAYGHHTIWVQGALETVDKVMGKLLHQ
ncbi:L-amino-acid oxidase-like [Physella acuta]|uniref:L-amino-acid oxidase-like n=1 Tax=Physella acuta TaxID=109671 RepID=UPI0027DD7163|nr:L-amino-acid oxidase-like [Physella acuta]